MLAVAGEILETDIGTDTYRLFLYDHTGVPSAIFVEPHPTAPGEFEAINIPDILKQFPSLLDEFAESLAVMGYTLREAGTGVPVREMLS